MKAGKRDLDLQEGIHLSFPLKRKEPLQPKSMQSSTETGLNRSLTLIHLLY